MSEPQFSIYFSEDRALPPQQQNAVIEARIAADVGENFERVFATEYIARDPLLSALEAYANAQLVAQGQKPVSLHALYQQLAVGAGRVFLQEPLIAECFPDKVSYKNGECLLVAYPELHELHGFMQGLGFCHLSLKSEGRGRFGYKPVLLVDTLLMRAIQQAGSEDLLQHWCAVFAPTLHDHIHNALYNPLSGVFPSADDKTLQAVNALPIHAETLKSGFNTPLTEAEGRKQEKLATPLELHAEVLNSAFRRAVFAENPEEKRAYVVQMTKCMRGLADFCSKLEGREDKQNVAAFFAVTALNRFVRLVDLGDALLAEKLPECGGQSLLQAMEALPLPPGNLFSHELSNLTDGGFPSREGLHSHLAAQPACAALAKSMNPSRPSPHVYEAAGGLPALVLLMLREGWHSGFTYAQLAEGRYDPISVLGALYQSVELSYNHPGAINREPMKDYLKNLGLLHREIGRQTGPSPTCP